MSKYYKAEDVINTLADQWHFEATMEYPYAADDIEEWKENARELYASLPTIEVSEDMGEVSDGYHTFNQLYHQRAVLFATIVNQNKDKAWKSWKHEDGKFCFDKGGEWFIVGIDTPEGSYTYHYEQTYWDMFDCEELDRGKHWDGHTEEDVTRLLSLPPVIPTVSEDCISRDWVLNRLTKYQKDYTFNELDDWQNTVVKWITTDIKNAPRVVPSRAEGEWVRNFDGNEWYWYCTNCKTQWYEEDLWMGGNEFPNYCPNCGAKNKG